MLRTTTAPTMLSASVKTNVLAIEAIATVNFRVHPRDTIGGIFDHVSAVVENFPLYPSDAADEEVRENLGVRRIIKKKT